GYFSAIISNKEEIYLRKKQTIEDILLTQMTIPEKLLTSYTSLGLSEVDVMLILQIYRFMQNGKDFPTPKEIADHLTIGEQDCAASLKKLIQKNILEIKELKNKNNQLSEAYSFEPLWEKLLRKKRRPRSRKKGTCFYCLNRNSGDQFLLLKLKQLMFGWTRIKCNRI